MTDIPPWALACAVLLCGAVLGAALSGDRGSRKEREKVDELSRTRRLEAERESVVIALKNLGLEKDKMSKAAYAREHDKLVVRGASILRDIDQGPTAETPAKAANTNLSEDLVSLLDTERRRLGARPLNLALDEYLGREEQVAPAPKAGSEWRGAFWAVAGMALFGVIFVAMSDDVAPRVVGGSITGPQPDAPIEGARSHPSTPKEVQDRLAAEAILKTSPEDVDALNTLTELSFAERDIGTAMAYNDRAFKADPTNKSARTYKAVMRSYVGMNDGALELIEDVLKEDPNFKMALVYKGLIAMDAGRPAMAVEALEKAMAGEAPNPFLQDRLRAARAAVNGETIPAPSMAPGAPETIVTGTITAPEGFAVPANARVFVSIRSPAGGPPLGALNLAAGPFPMDFKVTTADAISMGGRPRPWPDVIKLKVKVDTDGNAMTTEAGMPIAELDSVAKGSQDLVIALK